VTAEERAETELAVVAPFVPWEIGSVFAPSAIPLHVTMLSNFVIDRAQLSEVLDRIEHVATSTSPLIALGGRPELFGPLRNVKVTELADSHQLMTVHLTLRGAVGDLGRPVEPSYQDAGFRPHVTEVAGSGLAQGEQALLETFAVLDCTAVDRVVVASYPAQPAGRC
jgi:2'-5' RNA ligase